MIVKTSVARSQKHCCPKARTGSWRAGHREEMAAKSIADSAHGAGLLQGRRIVITRARQQASRLAQMIEDLGGEVVEFPTIEIRPPADYTAFDAAIENIETYQWVIFTSVNGVAPFLERLRVKQKPVSALKQMRV